MLIVPRGERCWPGNCQQTWTHMSDDCLLQGSHCHCPLLTWEGSWRHTQEYERSVCAGCVTHGVAVCLHCPAVPSTKLLVTDDYMFLVMHEQDNTVHCSLVEQCIGWRWRHAEATRDRNYDGEAAAESFCVWEFMWSDLRQSIVALRIILGAKHV